ncbi:MAG: hypothetical protein U0174_04965 [Polyangiaceae bacterium]
MTAPGAEECTRRVVIVGSGIAGTAAALALSARAANVDVTMIQGAAGSTVLAGGAFDGGDALSADARAVLSEIGFVNTKEGAIVATTAGRLREVSGMDSAMLDLGELSHTTVLLPRANHGNWDADYLARALSSDSLAKARGLRFAAVSARLVQNTEELSMADAELARRNSSEARVSWLASQLAPLRTEFPDAGACLLPPWLPLHGAALATLREKVAFPLGESVGLPPGPTGLRFLRARDASLAARKVRQVPGFVSSIMRDGEGFTVTLADESTVFAAVIILATGNLVSGGLRYNSAESFPAGELPVRSELPFALTFSAPVTLGASGRPLLVPGSLFGEAPETIAWPFVRNPLMERVGILTENRQAAPSIFACGDAEADSPRTWLGALEAGTQAGLSALLVV